MYLLFFIFVYCVFLLKLYSFWAVEVPTAPKPRAENVRVGGKNILNSLGGWPLSLAKGSG